jgi:hypothetical protein
MLVVIGTVCTGRCKSNYHTIMATTITQDKTKTIFSKPKPLIAITFFVIFCSYKIFQNYMKTAEIQIYLLNIFTKLPV